jgi:hypothetical protein
MANTVRLYRVLRATPDRVYRAFIDPEAMVKWLPPHGFTGKVHQAVQENLPDAIPLEACYLGWQESLQLLTQLVEAEIKQG